MKVERTQPLLATASTKLSSMFSPQRVGATSDLNQGDGEAAHYHSAHSDAEEEKEDAQPRSKDRREKGSGLLNITA